MRKLLILKDALFIAITHLNYKGLNDKFLIDNEKYQNSIKLIQKLYEDFKDQVNKHEKSYNDKFLLDFNNQLRVKTLFRELMKNRANKMLCSHTLKSIHDHHNVKFVGGG